MKYLYASIPIVALMLAACDSDSSSADDTPYGDLRYERHLPGSDATADCYVYSEGKNYTVVMEQHFSFLGSVTVVSQLELDSPSRIHEEVDMVGVIPAETSAEYCSQEKAIYETLMGGKVTCTKSKVTADAVVEEDEDIGAAELEEARRAAISKLSATCDDFIEQFEDEVLSEE